MSTCFQSMTGPKSSRRMITLMAIAWLCVVMTGCGGARPLMPTPTIYLNAQADPFADVPEAYRTPEVNMLYATDRVPNEVKGKFGYGYERSNSLAFGDCVVSIGEDVTWDDLLRNSVIAKRDVKLPIALASITELGRFPDTPDLTPHDEPAWKAADAAFLVQLRARLAKSPRKEAFIFVHGYHDSFAMAACTAAEIWHFLGREGVPLVYTWPAGHGGLLKGYDYDADSSAFTVYHFKQLIRLMASCEELQSISIIAHSRGTAVTVDTLRELMIAARAAGDEQCKSLKLNNVILAAADLDIQVATQRVAAEQLGAGANRSTVYVSQHDKALDLSGWLFADRRLGTLDYEDLTEFEKRMVADGGQMSVVDSRVHTKGIGHGYFHSVPAVSSDLILVLRENRDPGAENGRPLTLVGSHYWSLDKFYPNPEPPAKAK